MKVPICLSSAVVLATTTEAFTSSRASSTSACIQAIDTRHSILPQEVGIWSTNPPRGYVPPNSPHIDTRHAVILQEVGIHPTTPPPGWECPHQDGCSGEDIRKMWESYAPMTADGRVGSLGFVGCPGGGDWCYGSSGPAVSTSSAAHVTSAKTVAATLAGLSTSASSNLTSGGKQVGATGDYFAWIGNSYKSPPPKKYGLGGWKNGGGAARAITSTTTNIKLRRPIVAGNWNLCPSTRAEVITLLKLLAANFRNHRNEELSHSSPNTVIFPPLPYVTDAIQILQGTGIHVGAQISSSYDDGTFTEEIAPSMLVTLGCSYVLLGHSERRTLLGETNEDINASLKRCLDQPGLKVILCVGETLQEYESSLLETVVDIQIKKGLEGVDPSRLLNDRVIIAFVPPTGYVTTPQEAQRAHAAIRSSLRNMYGKDSGVDHSVRIQYGGSVSPDSIEELMGGEDVDGVLVGGANASNADLFTRIFDGTTTVNAKMKPVTFNRAPSKEHSPVELIATEVLSTMNALGESPVWSDRDQCLYWVSATEGEIWRWNLKDQPYRRLVNTAVGCVGILQSPIPGSIIIAGERAILTTSMISPGGDPNKAIPDFASGPSVLCDRPDHMSTTRPNDGRVDRFGNLVLGMYNQYHRAGPTAGENIAGLYRLNSRTLTWDEILDYRFRVSNCICFSEDGKTMYFGDTPTRKVYAFDYSPGGPLSNRRLVWSMPSEIPGGPDGAQVDSNGKLWVAITGANRVVQIDPDSGTIDTIVHLNANPTSLTFGGAELDQLFITTRVPNGGGLYWVKLPLGVRGIPEQEFTLGD